MLKNVVYLNNNDGTGLIGFGDGYLYKHDSADLVELQAVLNVYANDFRFLALSYDLKNEIESLESKNEDVILFPNALVYVPDFVAIIENDEINFLKGDSSDEALNAIHEFLKQQANSNKVLLKARTSKDEYINHVNALKDELQFGNIYEVNYCQEYFQGNVELEDTIGLYQQINEGTKTPFSTYFRLDEFELMCASPERFLQRIGNELISQPIKGTIKRGQTKDEDEALKLQLKNDPKERSENIMIVDLVRNDLSKIATKGSVEVADLCGIYSFETVHQMISTVHCTISDDVSFTDILRATFPMGSMTGAPKLSAMNLIEKHEDFKRGLYSGSVGYMSPNGDFDLNVIIRSVIYNRNLKTISCSVGSAITIQSDPEKEFEECQVKVGKILNILNGEA